LIFPIRKAVADLVSSTALEALIGKLREHLKRITSEFSTQKELLKELRSLRDEDAATLKSKVGEIEDLGREVQRLSGEVNVLRDVVEEGLKQRKSVREEQSRLNLSALEPSEDIFSAGSREREAHLATPAPPRTSSRQGQRATIQQPQQQQHQDPEEADEDDMSLESVQSPSQAFSRERSGSLMSAGSDDSGVEDSLVGRSGSTRDLPADRTMTMRTDRATMDSANPLSAFSAGSASGGSGAPSSSARTVDLSQLRPASPARRSPFGSPAGSPRLRGRSPTSGRLSPVSPYTVPIASSSDEEDAQAEAEPPRRARHRRSPLGSPTQERARPSAPTPGNHQQQQPRAASPARSSTSSHGMEDDEVARALAQSSAAPFPRIRGPALERLFFSRQKGGNDDNGKARTRVPTVGHGGDVEPGWLRNLAAQKAQARGPGVGTRMGGEWKQEHDEKLPPQTVLARVLRELEDDFRQYKGYVLISALFCHDQDADDDLSQHLHGARRAVRSHGRSVQRTPSPVARGPPSRGDRRDRAQGRPDCLAV
jgi:hypothetical protein